MYKDVSTFTKVCAFALASALADCSGSLSSAAPPVAAASASQAAAPVERPNAVKAALANCLSGFSCETATPVASLGVIRSSPDVVLEAETPAKPFVLTASRFTAIAGDTLIVQSSCGTCHIIASAAPLTLHVATWVADVEGPLAQSRTYVTTKTQWVTLAPGRYYFYVANV